MKYHVRDHYPNNPGSRFRPSQYHGTRTGLDEAKQIAWDVAVSRGFDPDTLRWRQFTATTWGLLAAREYTYVGVETEAEEAAGALVQQRAEWRRGVREMAGGQCVAEGER